MRTVCLMSGQLVEGRVGPSCFPSFIPRGEPGTQETLTRDVSK